EVTEVTGLVDLSVWPEGIRMVARREDPHPGAQLTFTDVDGHRFQVFVTDLAEGDTAFDEAVYRGRGRAERLICDSKDTGLANLPSWSFAINQVWLQLALTAMDLFAWSKVLLLDGDLARAEPKRLRYCLLHTAGQIVRSGRRRYLRVAHSWPWADQLPHGLGGAPAGGLEGDHRAGVGDPGQAGDAPGDDLGQFLLTPYPDDGHEVGLARDGIHLGHAVDVGQLAGKGGDAGRFGV